MSAIEFSEADIEERAKCLCVRAAQGRPPDSALCLMLTSLATRVSAAELRGKDRHKSIAYARHVAMFVARRVTGESFPEIGRAFGRDHTTVMAGVARVRGLVARDAPTASLVMRIEREARGIG